jgi:hypothetical protein
MICSCALKVKNGRKKIWMNYETLFHTVAFKLYKKARIIKRYSKLCVLFYKADEKYLVSFEKAAQYLAFSAYQD